MQGTPIAPFQMGDVLTFTGCFEFTNTVKQEVSVEEPKAKLWANSDLVLCQMEDEFIT